MVVVKDELHAIKGFTHTGDTHHVEQQAANELANREGPDGWVDGRLVFH